MKVGIALRKVLSHNTMQISGMVRPDQTKVILLGLLKFFFNVSMF